VLGNVLARALPHRPCDWLYVQLVADVNTWEVFLHVRRTNSLWQRHKSYRLFKTKLKKPLKKNPLTELGW